MVGFFFQDLVSVNVEISQVKLFDTFMNCYRFWIIVDLNI